MLTTKKCRPMKRSITQLTLGDHTWQFQPGMLARFTTTGSDNRHTVLDPESLSSTIL